MSYQEALAPEPTMLPLADANTVLDHLHRIGQLCSSLLFSPDMASNPLMAELKNRTSQAALDHSELVTILRDKEVAITEADSMRGINLPSCKRRATGTKKGIRSRMTKAYVILVTLCFGRHQADALAIWPTAILCSFASNTPLKSGWSTTAATRLLASWAGHLRAVGGVRVGKDANRSAHWQGA
ncbi:hypothetical protein BC828DRAFT_401431 [Blastocladiella britannica]|nr:hypothetical protein BC828DRAFT_401431 [Blastocladiella britannica]